jgi:adenine-specific DNA methylase
MERLLKPALSSLEKHIRVINQGVFTGPPVTGYQQDAFEFVAQVRGDILYLDPPPYPATVNYETANQTLDAVLFEQTIRRSNGISPFSKGTQALADLLDTAKYSPVWVLSYGNRVVSLEELTALVKRVAPERSVYSEARAYKHLPHVSKNTHNQELLVIAYQ